MAKTIVMPKEKRNNKLKNLSPSCGFSREESEKESFAKFAKFQYILNQKKKKGSQPINAPKALITKKKKKFLEKGFYYSGIPVLYSPASP